MGTDARDAVAFESMGRLKKGKRVLFVEDDEDILSGLTRLLRSEGFEVIPASTGGEALRVLREEKAPDYVILDLMLPDRLGMELIGPFKSRWPAAEIFIYTSYPEYVEKYALGESAAAVFKKNEFNELLSRLR
ncbi:MAG TPA: response regulator [bacterium]|nr:response regulator [bacterium]